MTTIDSIHSHLDQQPSDHTARLVLADAVEEAGGCGSGWRALAVLERVPELPTGKTLLETGAWFLTDNWNHPHDPWSLPADWFNLLPSPPYRGSKNLDGDWNGLWARAATRRELEEAAVAAFQRLPPERQQQLLAGIRESQLETAQ